jgi:hypothetical protein
VPRPRTAPQRRSSRSDPRTPARATRRPHGPIVCASGTPTGLAAGFGPEARRPYAPSAARFTPEKQGCFPTTRHALVPRVVPPSPGHATGSVRRESPFVAGRYRRDSPALTVARFAQKIIITNAQSARHEVGTAARLAASRLTKTRSSITPALGSSCSPSEPRNRPRHGIRSPALQSVASPILAEIWAEAGCQRNGTLTHSAVSRNHDQDPIGRVGRVPGEDHLK